MAICAYLHRSMKLTKTNAPKKSGGKRPNSGAKPKGDAPNYNSFSFRPSNDVKEILSRQVNKSEFINQAILAYELHISQRSR